MPGMPESGQDLAWAARSWRLFLGSLERLARVVERSPQLAEARALGGSNSLFTLRGGPSSGARLMQKTGFTVVPYYRPWGSIGEWWENTYSWWLFWAYNPGSMKSREYDRLERTEVWMTVSELIRRFGCAQHAGELVPSAAPAEVGEQGRR